MFFCSFLAILGLLFALFCLKVCARSSKLERPNINSNINLIDSIPQYHISIYIRKILKSSAYTSNILLKTMGVML